MIKALKEIAALLTVLVMIPICTFCGALLIFVDDHGYRSGWQHLLGLVMLLLGMAIFMYQNEILAWGESP